MGYNEKTYSRRGRYQAQISFYISCFTLLLFGRIFHESKGLVHYIGDYNQEQHRPHSSFLNVMWVMKGMFSFAEPSGSNVKEELVVDVNQTHLFWHGGQARLCDVLRQVKGTGILGAGIPNTSLPTRPLMNMSVDCIELKKREDFGQGNWITAVYCVRIAAALAGVDFQFQCSDKRESQLQLLLPWFEGRTMAPNSSKQWPFGGTLPTEEEACTDSYPSIRVDKMVYQIRNDIQKMAVKLVGSRGETRRHPEIPINLPPLIPGVVLDDVAIHFRCGDIFGGARRNDFGLIKFSEYRKYISRTARSVGILTQPFSKKFSRRVDAATIESCRNATYLLVDYLQQFLPNAIISIHNDENETLPLAYARLAMANQSFTSLSSFGIFPVIGTFGDGYFQRGNRGVNPWASHVPSILSNVHEMNSPVLTSWAISKMELNETLAWLVSS